MGRLFWQARRAPALGQPWTCISDSGGLRVGHSPSPRFVEKAVEMPCPRSERRSTWPAVVLMGLVLSAVLYVASIGPAGRFVPRPVSDSFPPGTSWDTAYAPILWATDRSDALSHGLRIYLRFWDADGAAGRVEMRRRMRVLIDAVVRQRRYRHSEPIEWRLSEHAP